MRKSRETKTIMKSVRRRSGSDAKKKRRKSIRSMMMILMMILTGVVQGNTSAGPASISARASLPNGAQATTLTEHQEATEEGVIMERSANMASNRTEVEAGRTAKSRATLEVMGVVKNTLVAIRIAQAVDTAKDAMTMNTGARGDKNIPPAAIRAAIQAVEGVIPEGMEVTMDMIGDTEPSAKFEHRALHTWMQ